MVFCYSKTRDQFILDVVLSIVHFCHNPLHFIHNPFFPSFLQPELRSSLVLSMLKQMLVDDKAESVRQAVVKSLGVIVAFIDDDDKFKHCWELMLRGLNDPSQLVVTSVYGVLLPALAAWSYELGSLENELISYFSHQLLTCIKVCVCVHACAGVREREGNSLISSPLSPLLSPPSLFLPLPPPSSPSSLLSLLPPLPSSLLSLLPPPFSKYLVQMERVELWNSLKTTSSPSLTSSHGTTPPSYKQVQSCMEIALFLPLSSPPPLLPFPLLLSPRHSYPLISSPPPFLSPPSPLLPSLSSPHLPSPPPPLFPQAPTVKQLF